MKKTQLNKNKVTYFGVKFTPNGIEPDEQKITDLKEAEPPINAKEALSFICMAQALC